MDDGIGDIICLGCSEIMENQDTALILGCPHCQGRKFRIIPNKSSVSKQVKTNIGANIKVKERGKYEIDLTSLLKREQNEPITLEDANGVVRMVFNPDL